MLGEQRSVENGLQVAGIERLALGLLLLKPHFTERIRPWSILGD
jgi:hypothetical protein